MQLYVPSCKGASRGIAADGYLENIGRSGLSIVRYSHFIDKPTLVIDGTGTLDSPGVAGAEISSNGSAFYFHINGLSKGIGSAALTSKLTINVIICLFPPAQTFRSRTYTYLVL